MYFFLTIYQTHAKLMHEHSGFCCSVDYCKWIRQMVAWDSRLCADCWRSIFLITEKKTIIFHWVLLFQGRMWVKVENPVPKSGDVVRVLHKILHNTFLDGHNFEWRSITQNKWRWNVYLVSVQKFAKAENGFYRTCLERPQVVKMHFRYQKVNWKWLQHKEDQVECGWMK